MAVLSVVKPKGRNPGALLRELTPEALRRAVRQAKAGEPLEYFRVLEDVHAVDDEVRASLTSLTAAVLSKGAKVEPDDDSDEAHEQADYLEAVYDELDGDALIEHLAQFPYFGVRGIEADEWGEIEVAARGARARRYQAPLHFEALPQEWFYAKKEAATDDVGTLYVGAEPLHAYEPGAVVVVTDQKLKRATTPNFVHLGVGAGCARLAIFRYYQPEDWSAFNEVFGMPLVLGKLLAGFTDADRRMLEDAVFGLSADARAVISEKTTIEFPEASRASSAEVYERFLDSCGMGIARFLKGESMTDRSNKYGSNAAMVTTNGVRLDHAARVASRVERALDRRLTRPALRRNWARPRARLTLPLARVVDLVAEARVDRELQAMGYPLSRREASQRYGRALAEGDDILRAGAGAGFDPFALG